MALLNFTAAAHAVGVNRSTIARAVKSGRLSTATNDAGERCIDTSELMRVFGMLQNSAQSAAYATPTLAQDNNALIETLQEQLHQAYEREQKAQEREAQLLALLQAEQTARRELEQRLLPAPPHPVPTRARWWLLVAVLIVGLAVVGWQFRVSLMALLIE